MRDIILIKLRSSVYFKTPPLGIGYLLKALDGIDDINPVFIDCQLNELSTDDLLAKLRNYDPLVVGLQVFSEHYPQLCSLVPEIRRIFKETVIIAGGPHPSGLPEETLNDNSELDYLVKGEGEEALEGLVRALLSGRIAEERENIPNLVYRSGDKVVFNPQRFIDVDRYGPPDWERLGPDKYPPIQHGTFHKSTKVVPIITSRGCPYPCTYCAGHLLTGKKIRRRKPCDIVDEIEFLQNRYGFEEFIVEDENFTYYPDHVFGVSRELKRRGLHCYFSFPNGIRIDRITEEIVRELKEMGTYMVRVGLESGSEKTLKAMKKNLDLNEVKKNLKILKRHKIIVNGAFILGFSGETMEDIEKTIQFAIDSGIDTAYIGNYLPLPGSEDFNRLVAEGEIRIDEINWSLYTAYYGKIAYHPVGMTAEELLKAVRRATLRFYLRPGPIWSLMKRMSRPVFIRNMFFRIRSLFFKRN
jgi:anaerobic magnesium-protoporphyrin IX monomethyl ester cyclase